MLNGPTYPIFLPFYAFNTSSKCIIGCRPITYHFNLHSFRFAQAQIAMKVAELLFYFLFFCYTPYSRYTTEHGGGSRIDSSILE